MLSCKLHEKLKGEIMKVKCCPSAIHVAARNCKSSWLCAREVAGGSMRHTIACIKVQREKDRRQEKQSRGALLSSRRSTHRGPGRQAHTLPATLHSTASRRRCSPSPVITIITPSSCSDDTWAMAARTQRTPGNLRSTCMGLIAYLLASDVAARPRPVCVGVGVDAPNMHVRTPVTYET